MPAGALRTAAVVVATLVGASAQASGPEPEKEGEAPTVQRPESVPAGEKDEKKAEKEAKKEEKKAKKEEKKAKREEKKAKKKAGAGASVSTQGGAEVGAAADEDTDVSTSRRYSERGRPPDRSKWIYRWRPQNNMGEVGVYGGVWFPSRHLELFETDHSLEDQGFQKLQLVAPDVGVRGGYYPFWFFGIELEGGVMPTKTEDTDKRALPWTVRGHLVGQLGLWSITPFLLVGSGVLGVASDAPAAGGVGNDQDVTIHFGGGVKFFINRWIMLRLDVRDIVSNRRGVGEGLTSSPEILLGLSVTLGRDRKRKPRPGSEDRDGDKIRDADDYCPDVFGVAPRGCPQVCIDDSDGDGLTDPEDDCPKEPETRNGYQDGDGCPDEIPPELSDLAGVMEAIHFDTDKDTIKRGSRPTLDRAVEVMQKYPELHVEVSGHTDSQGTYRHNMDLSRRRAESVKRYMVDKGVKDERLSTRGVGPNEPIDTNETEAGRAKNRRIEFRILDEKERRGVGRAKGKCED